MGFKFLFKEHKLLNFVRLRDFLTTELV